MATTYLEVINRVLEKIGEDTISGAATSLTETYEILVGSFVNDIKEEVEDSHNWRALRQTVSATVLAGTNTITITEANERSRLVRLFQSNRGCVVPLVFDITEANNPDPLREIDLSELIYRDTLDPDIRQEPTYFALDNSSGDVLDLYVWPRPSNDTTIQLTLIIPQPRFGNADLGEVIKIPVRPIVIGATWYALEERGEELGTSGMFNEKRYNEATSTAIARDEAEQGSSMELVRV